MKYHSFLPLTDIKNILFAISVDFRIFSQTKYEKIYGCSTPGRGKSNLLRYVPISGIYRNKSIYKRIRFVYPFANEMNI